jgi:GNAT superfamily N-acetyltransferase
VAWPDGLRHHGVVVGEPFTIRRASGGDLPFLTDMLIEAVNWHPQRKTDRSQILATPELAHYISGWPRPGDLGVVAEAASVPIGAAWLRFFPAEDPGYGFIGPDVPELTLGVVASWRGQGVGRSLLRAVEADARAAGIRRISLSVQRANRARSLYLAEGFVVVASTRDADTMVQDLQ